MSGQKDTMIQVVPETARQLQRNTDQMGAYLLQLAAMMQTMQRRMDEMEARERQVTLCHEEVKIIQTLIRMRADEYCEKYGITDAGSRTAVRGSIKREILRRYGVKDLHDVPAIARQAVEAQISHWANIRLVMARREKIREIGA